MVRYGMVWYCMVWYGMVWYGMVWYGMVRCGPKNAMVTLHIFIAESFRMLAHQNTQQLLLLVLCPLFHSPCAYTQVQYHEANRFRTAASAAAAGAAPGLNEADRAYRQMVADPSSSIHPMLRYLADPYLHLTLSNVHVTASVPSA